MLCKGWSLKQEDAFSSQKVSNPPKPGVACVPWEAHFCPHRLGSICIVVGWMVALETYVHILTPATYEQELIGKESICRGN